MLHPQVSTLLERAAQSPLPPYHEVPPAVARRLYRDTRAALTPDPPAVESSYLLLAPGPGGPVPVRAYRPRGAGKDEVLPALVYFHGGGWVIGDLDTHDVVCRTLANGARCAVFSVEYRKAPDAGGPALSFQLLIYPGTDQRMGHASIEGNGEGYLLTKKSMLYFRGHYLPRKEDWLDWRASPLLAKSLGRLPPAYVMTAGFDPLLDEGRAYAERLKRDGVATEYREYPDMVHGFVTMGRVLDTANAALAECARALKKAWRT